MKRLSSAAVLAAFALGACKDASSPAGGTGSLTVRTYFDVDASGTLTAGDTPLGNFAVALLRDGTQIATATTHADGTISFHGLRPGSYAVRAIGNVPFGAVLTTNPQPAIAVGFQGGSQTVDFRFTSLPASVSGRIFREDNGTAGYQTGGDTPGSGLKVYLHANNGGAAGAKIDSVTTDAEGAYVFPRIAPGTYFVSFENPGTIDYGASAAPQQITVGGQQTAQVNATYTGSLILTVAQARGKATGTAVAIVGSIVVPPGVFTSGTGGVNSEIWVQDASGGIAAFAVPSTRTDLPIGQKVLVTGTLGVFGGQLQINGPTATPQTGTQTIGATTLSVTAANALGANEGKLVAVNGVKLGTVTTPSSSGAFTVKLVNATSDTIQFRINGSATGITPANFVAGNTYTVTGVLTQFNGTAQLKPRSPGDISFVTPGRIVINEVMPNPNKVADNFGEYVELFNAGGTAVSIQGWTINDNTAPQAITAAITIQPGGYALLAPSADPLINGGLPTVDFAYNGQTGGIQLAQGGDFVVLKDQTGATIDSVRYATSSGSTAGVARGVINAGLDNADMLGTNWAAQTTQYNGTDFGTPRAQNSVFTPPTIAPFEHLVGLTGAATPMVQSVSGVRAAPRGPARLPLPPTR